MIKSVRSVAIQFTIVSLIALQRESIHKRIDNSEPFRKSYDYIVVGAGSAGCVVAKRLSDNARVSVLLLEAGGPQSFMSDIPGVEQTLLADNPQYNWNYEIYPQRKVGLGRAQPGVYPEPKGRIIGGSSTMNRMIYLRGNRRDFDNWVKTYGAYGWSYEEVLPYFIKSENNSDYKLVAQNPHFHGTDGPLGVTSDPNLNLFLRKVQKAYNMFGIPTTDINGPKQAGSAFVQLNIKDGFRSSTANAYIDPNPNPNNLFISIYSFVTQILFNKIEGKLMATGVEFNKNKRKYILRANKEVIICAGSYNSPQLLMLSGIGPKEHLNELNIQALVDLPVGERLQDHLQLTFWSPILNNTFVEAFPELNIQQLYQLISENSGPLATSTALYTYFSTKSNPDPYWPNIVLSNRIGMFSNNITDEISDYSAQRADEWIKYFGPYLGEPHLISDIFLRRPRSVGWVRLSSANPYAMPIINPNFLYYEQDFEDLVESAKFQLFFLQNSIISKNIFLIPKPIPGCSLCKDRPIYDCDSYIRCYIRQIGDKEHHSCGTCRMGSPERPDTVVDPNLRVKYVSNLRVCDASVVPRIPNSNINALTVMIAEKCSQLIQKDYKY